MKFAQQNDFSDETDKERMRTLEKDGFRFSTLFPHTGVGTLGECYLSFPFFLHFLWQFPRYPEVTVAMT